MFNFKFFRVFAKKKLHRESLLAFFFSHEKLARLFAFCLNGG